MGAVTATRSWKRNKQHKKKGEMQEFQQTETNKGTGDALRRKKKKHTNKKV